MMDFLIKIVVGTMLVSMQSVALDQSTCDTKFQTTDGGIVEYWTFDDQLDPTVGDYSNVHGTNHGAVWTSTGVVGGALDFDGYASYVDLGTSINVPSWPNYTIAVWFLNDGDGEIKNGSGAKIFDKTTWYSDFYLSVAINWQDRLVFYTYQGGGAGLQDPPPSDLGSYWGDDVWHHAVIVKSGGNGQLWVDGVVKASGPLKTVYNSVPLYLGYSPAGDSNQRTHWGGMIDEFAIFDRALTEDEVAELYATSNGGFDYCAPAVTVSLDPMAQAYDATVDIRYAASGLGHGDSFVPEGAYQYRVNIGGYAGGWQSGPSGVVLDIDEGDEYAIQTIALDSGVPAETSVDIRYGANNDRLLEEESFAAPMGNYQYRVDACGLTGPWKDFNVTASGELLVRASDDVALVDIMTDTNLVTVDIRYGTDNDGLSNGDIVCAPSPKNLQYRVKAGGFNGNWLDLPVDGDTTLTVFDGDQYATISVIDVPIGGTVDIRYGSDNDGLIDDGTFLSPIVQNRQWRLNVGGHTSGWFYYTVADPYQLSVTHGQAYAEILVNLGTFMELSGLPLHEADPTARIDIRYGTPDLAHGSHVVLPCTNIQWRLKTENGSLKGPWTTHSVCGEGNIEPTAAVDAKELQFNFDWTTSRYAKTKVRYVRTFTNCNGTGSRCERLVSPCGINVQARPDLGNVSPAWMTDSVDCNWDTWTWQMDAEVSATP